MLCFDELLDPRPESHYCVTFQTQVVRNNEVVFAVERESPTEQDMRDMQAECVRWGALLSELRVVSADAPLYAYRFRPRSPHEDRY